MNPMGALAAVSLLSGIAMRWIFRRAANYTAIRAAWRHIQAHLLEFWIFVDEPPAIWKSWKGLLAANARLLGRLLVPFLILSIPVLPLFFALDAFYGTSPLAVGKPAVVTLAFNRPIDSIPRLQAPDGIAIESPAVRVFTERQVSWRIRPLRPLSGELYCLADNTELAARIVAGAGFFWHSRRGWSWPLLRKGPLGWIDISYPPATVALCGIEAPWLVWFSAFSLLGACLGSAAASLGRRVSFE